MENIQLKAYGKINLGLDVIRKREDGYHELNMIMQTVDIYDDLYLEKLEKDEIELEVDRQDLESDENNLVYKAIKLIKDEYRVKGGVRAVLNKRIPIAAGMAGGSADCAATLVGMNKLYKLNIDTDKLCELGKRLGADVPYCIVGGTCRAQGIGEVLTSLRSVQGDYILLAKPNISVSTKYVYDNLNINETNRRHPNIDIIIEAINEGDNNKIYANLENILESVTVEKYSIIDDIKKELVHYGAKIALMSGSGPTVFAIFEDKGQAESVVEDIKDKFDLDVICVVEFVGKEKIFTEEVSK